MVSKASDDFPEPDRPVNTTSWSRGISTSMPLRLCSRAPRMAMTRRSCASLAALRACETLRPERRPCSKRSFMDSDGFLGAPLEYLGPDFGMIFVQNVVRTRALRECEGRDITVTPGA